MRDPRKPELHAAALIAPDQPLPLKQQALLFDKIHLIRPDDAALGKWFDEDSRNALIADIDYLQAKGVVECNSTLDLMKAAAKAPLDEQKKKQHTELLSDAARELLRSKFPILFSSFKPPFARVRDPKQRAWNEETYTTPEAQRRLFDFYIRLLAAGLTRSSQTQTVPICWDELPDSLPAEGQSLGCGLQDVLHISFDYFPVPDDTWAWEEILEFKKNLDNKQWDLRHFLTTLASKPMAEKDVREQIEYNLHQYEEAMKLHTKKSSHSFIDVFIVAPIELIEDIVKFKWSQILKGGMAARRRKLELLEAETKAPGKECAYVFDARKRFGNCSDQTSL